LIGGKSLRLLAGQQGTTTGILARALPAGSTALYRSDRNARQARDDWRKRLCVSWKNEDVRDPVQLPKFQQTLNHVIRRSNQVVR
jgi:hypothetical protein